MTKGEVKWQKFTEVPVRLVSSGLKFTEVNKNRYQ